MDVCHSGEELSISPSQILHSIRRCAVAKLVEHGIEPKPFRPNLKEFLIHGVKYSFPAVAGTLSRGVPTAHAAAPLKSVIADTGDPPPVWPYPRGNVRGIALEPIHRAVPEAALKDSKLYQMLALLDAIRAGRAREREIAVRELTARIEGRWNE